MTTAVEDPDACLLCGTNPATRLGFCDSCREAAVSSIDTPWDDQ